LSLEPGNEAKAVGGAVDGVTNEATTVERLAPKNWDFIDRKMWSSPTEMDLVNQHKLRINHKKWVSKQQE
jgi:hypothetical protein